jgi:hypothetical protein
MKGTKLTHLWRISHKSGWETNFAKFDFNQSAVNLTRKRAVP